MKVNDMVEFIYSDFGVGIILDIIDAPYSGQPVALILFPKNKRPVWLDLRDLNKIEEWVYSSAL